MNKKIIQFTNLLEAIFEDTNTRIACMDRDLGFLRVNKAYADANGKEPGHFAGKRYFDLFRTRGKRPFSGARSKPVRLQLDPQNAGDNILYPQDLTVLKMELQLLTRYLFFSHIITVCLGSKRLELV